MHVELTPQQRDQLLQLLDAAIRELGPEIRHTDVSSFKDELKLHRHELCNLRELLTRAGAGTGDRSDLVGTP